MSSVNRPPAVMRMMMMPALHSAALLLLLLSGTLTSDTGPVPIQVEVQNSLQPDSHSLIYNTYVVYRGILLGAMRRLMNSTSGFEFTYTEDLNYGPYLESVNGLAGSTENHTYWELLVESPIGNITRLNV
ncbi:hypothetical protein INR49_003169, partial [Caranx melampygus]